MQYVQLKERLKDFTVFSITDVSKIDNNFHRRRLNEWQDKGYLRKIVRGYYIFSDVKLDEHALFEIANRIYAPSYISFEMALAYYGLIPESVYGITSACTRRTYTFKTKIGNFAYKTLRPRLYFGYDITENNDKNFKIASPEKAILDYLYLNSGIKNKNGFASLRLNRENFFKLIDKEKIEAFLNRFDQNTLTKRMRSLWRFMENA